MAKKSEYHEIIITGFGGQGIILAGNILGKSATLFEKKNATLIQSYGPEARGGSCVAQVVVSEENIEYPYVENPHVLICMSQDLKADQRRGTLHGFWACRDRKEKNPQGCQSLFHSGHQFR